MLASLALGTAAQAADVTLVYAETNSAESPSGQIALHFKEKVEELTGGSVEIDFQGNGVLGTEVDILNGMVAMAGTVDIERVTSSRLANYKCNKNALLGLPFTFENRDHFWKFVDSELGAEVLAEPAEVGIGVTGLFFSEEGFRHFFFTKPCESFEDLAGRKIRVAEDAIMQGVCEGVGAAPTVVAYNELYTSLQSGVVDGAEQPFSPYQDNAFYEVAPYMLLDQHTMGVATVVISDLAKMKLSEEQWAAVQEAAKDTEAFAKKTMEESDAAIKTSLEEKGVIFTEVTDFAPYKEGVTEVIAKFTEGLEDLYQGIVDLA